ncbi:DUF3944 domain-containing protein [Desulfonatronovibrio magnus]|uniref:DUF3944 domain-containing protein n=1 Tax=Desulfonatronovibrio magnus TaxID=698827 RepID=UPI0005EAF4C8|nr:DUF3944 domain-containing protein [Desulfonatronovibrio magnus]
MGLRYRIDPDLDFLQYCEHDDLSVLVDILTKTKSGNQRFTESLTQEQRFKSCTDYSEIWDLIAAEVQHFGGDTFVNLFRGKGVLYRKILSRVCSKFSLKCNDNSKTLEIENELLMKVVEKSLEEMDERQRAEFVKDFNLDVQILAPPVIMAALQTAIKLNGFLAYKLAVIVANAVARAILGRGLALGANAALVRGVAMFAGPIGWAITALLALPLVSGPAYRVIMPATLHICYMRYKLLGKKEGFI